MSEFGEDEWSEFYEEVDEEEETVKEKRRGHVLQDINEQIQKAMIKVRQSNEIKNQVDKLDNVDLKVAEFKNKENI